MPTQAPTDGEVDDDRADPITLVLVDDHDLVRQGVKALIEAEGDLLVVGEAATAAEAIRRVGFDEPDVVVLDLDLPDGSGVEVCRRIAATSPKTRVLILTAFADQSALAAARTVGAAGFILKRIHQLDLVDAIRRVARGETAFDNAPDTNQPPTSSEDGRLARLTDRERLILELVAEGKTNREIADELFLSEKTIKNYVSNVLLKVGFRHRSGAAAYLVHHQEANRHSYPPAEWRKTAGHR
ncbi:MAG: response regulator [Acidimicrobiia bacterium]